MKERLVVQGKYGQVDPGSNRLELGGELLARFIGLNEDLAGEIHHMSVGQDAITRDHDS